MLLVRGQRYFKRIPNRKKKMMEQQFFEDEFEQFLRQNADQHRMYPSEGVWTNIYRHLHSGRRRIALGAMLLLVMSGIIWLANTDTISVSSKNPQAYSPVIQSNRTRQTTTSRSSVTVDDIIEKLRAKSLIPPMAIAAPLSLSPLQLYKPAHLSDTYKVSDTQTPFTYPTENPAGDLTGIITESDESFVVSRLVAKKAPVIRMQSAQPEVREPKLALSTPILALNTPKSDFSTQVKISPVKKSTRNKVSYLMSFAPSIGYRNLFDGKNHITYGNSPLMVRHLNVNQFVDHQPAIGFELGGGIRYQVSRGFAIRTGLQLNLTRFSIAAFSHSPEKTTLSLTSAYGYQRETVATSNVRNIVGNDPERLQNQYLQLAVPIAAELKLFGDNKLQLNIAGSIQPVYLLNTNQYLLSNDFSNYVKEPSLIRRWNMATSIEAFISYTTRELRWQVGPQFRYNLMSTYKNQYPIRENLMEYGVKFGVSKTIK
ncbi:hypothetical protein [Flavihumibacter fluvii]|uniref:hypothetical protein n=1 Tax=Flavihumibacter fluvii TaxID=2838157 RepID=UPI001BDE150F|nr:hypothetical protein [Flavihumibacter fluvii]ULQ52464.1 hypothetical protein KJS93_20460 [Flavihumibacter fluvii]